jgi:hypothetical protein
MMINVVYSSCHIWYLIPCILGFLNALIFFNQQRTFITRKIKAIFGIKTKHNIKSFQWVDSKTSGPCQSSQVLGGGSLNLEPSTHENARSVAEAIPQQPLDIECVSSIGHDHQLNEFESNGEQFSISSSSLMEHAQLAGLVRDLIVNQS